MMNKTVAELASRWLGRPSADLTELENLALQSAIDRKTVSRHREDRQTPGERIADGIARVGGSWTFILWFLAFLVVWTVSNAWLLDASTFDPYPFVFLNLILSMLAALQAPVIMMSQNRQAERDRREAEHDYAVNLKAEIEIMALHEKLDEMRHSEIIAARDDIAKMAQTLARIERTLAVGGSQTK